MRVTQAASRALSQVAGRAACSGRPHCASSWIRWRHDASESVLRSPPAAFAHQIPRAAHRRALSQLCGDDSRQGEKQDSGFDSMRALAQMFAVGCAVACYERTKTSHCSSRYANECKYEQKLFSPTSVSKIATMINALVDMEYFTEEEEQEIFEHSVCLVLHEIEKSLPDTVIRLILETDYEDGVDDDMAETINQRLLEYVTSNVSLPYLDYTDESRVMAAVCAVIVESMKKGRSFDEVVEPVNSGELIIDVFVKGTVHMFDHNKKKEFINNICVDLQIPFVPEPAKRFVVRIMLDAVGDVFDEAILQVYQHRISEAYQWAAERTLDARDSEEWEQLAAINPNGRWLWSRDMAPIEVAMGAPAFTSGRLFHNGHLVLPSRHGEGEGEEGRKTYGEEVRDTLVDALNDKINVIGWMGDKFEEWEGVLIRKVVDLTLMQGMDLEKLEIAITYLCKENFLAALRHEWYESFRQAQLPAPTTRCAEEWYWELAGEMTAIDLERIQDIKQEPKGRTKDAKKLHIGPRRRTGLAPS